MYVRYLWEVVSALVVVAVKKCEECLEVDHLMQKRCVLNLWLIGSMRGGRMDEWPQVLGSHSLTNSEGFYDEHSMTSATVLFVPRKSCQNEDSRSHTDWHVTSTSCGWDGKNTQEYLPSSITIQSEFSYVASVPEKTVYVWQNSVSRTGVQVLIQVGLVHKATATVCSTVTSPSPACLTIANLFLFPHSSRHDRPQLHVAVWGLWRHAMQQWIVVPPG